MMNIRKKQVMERVHVIKQVFEIIKFIGKQNLSYRGTNEGLYDLEDLNINHGNFLELLKFTAENDTVLKKYLTEALQRSKKRRENVESNSKGRGSLITLLSKTTVNKIIEAILVTMRKIIKNELGDRQFSIQVDSTQDIGANDQAAICLRYVFNSKVKERLFSVVEVTDSLGKGMYELIAKVFSKHGILFKNIIGSSSDGAANMQGEYNGFRAHIMTENKNSVYIWCYAHILNLRVCDICGNVAALSLFGLLNRLATFFSDSYKRMNVWKETQEKLGTGQKKNCEGSRK
ncbi:zinc finger MYM-type protein 1-like [Aphis gossypii]|uniref:zinc finger MYM-type protein 1-like n=1 Tax=Aphis gossypii TaxID=80765 RepID=UPI0021592DC3|nr:zinc finger MYM-type protein 1-like [Aphis gossypii]